MSAYDGSVYGLAARKGFFGFFTKYVRIYVAGPREGQSEELTEDQFNADMKLAEETWGKLIPGGYFTEPFFIPGTKRSRLPLWDDFGREIGYIDREGVHRYNRPIGLGGA